MRGTDVAQRPVTEENIRLVGSLIESDCRLTVAEIASEVGISFGSAQAIITDDLGFGKVSATWVPRLLTENQKRYRLEVCKRLLTRYQAEGEAFLHRIVTCDETWVHHYTPESKEASMEWRKKSESAFVKAKTQFLAGKVLATVFCLL
ncbi:PREDICTED: histone-lysine N-methyltransferase SETMAR-like [Dinoponera quadriceps]|uniref:Histone-lysine N-methyltransferase SETMAR-like n=1 Tax=Dinoponera quadriceps TaxID=609295 RepID=A0A6P3YAF9_DINQU|nr:PREDICTED: histone-lysine N-methyltransferase SETMAR-like [Dinoponera quadriceps]